MGLSRPRHSRFSAWTSASEVNSTLATQPRMAKQRFALRRRQRGALRQGFPCACRPIFDIDIKLHGGLVGDT